MSEGKLHAKLAEVVAEVGYVAKDGKNEFQNYRYTSAEALLAEVRKPLSAKRVTLMPALRDITEREYQTSKGKASVITTAHVRFTFVDGETGEREECDWAGQGDDPADKGLGKAFTNAIKTFLRETFLIPTGDDPEADSATDSRAADRAPRQQQAQRNGSEYATKADQDALAAAAKGLTVRQIKLALGSVGSSFPEKGDVFSMVPKGTTRRLTELLAGTPREKPVPAAPGELS
jgi:hypothetical protein